MMIPQKKETIILSRRVGSVVTRPPRNKQAAKQPMGELQKQGEGSSKSMSDSSSNSSNSSSSSSSKKRSDDALTATELVASSVAVQTPSSSSTTEAMNASVLITDSNVITTEEQKKETVQVPIDHIDGENPSIKCRCGCVPKDMMSLFQMAELRARFREEKKRKETEAAAQNLPQGRM